ncbi:hypothetical protein D3C85_1833950 [compost metagenome]
MLTTNGLMNNILENGEDSALMTLHLCTDEFTVGDFTLHRPVVVDLGVFLLDHLSQVDGTGLDHDDLPIRVRINASMAGVS